MIKFKINNLKLKTSSGFSLIEIILAMSIAIIFFGSIKLNFNILERYKIYFLAHKIQNDLRYAQSQALDQNLKHEIYFDINNNFYEIKSISQEQDLESNSSLIKKIYYLDKSLKLYKLINLDNNLQEISKNNFMISYNPNGSLSSGSCSIIIYSKHYKINLTILLNTGRVKIKELTQK
jgi:Tfp pilus assembly protein FimT